METGREAEAMSRFIVLHCGDETAALLSQHPNAFLLLTQIAMRAKWKDCPVTRLKAGQAFIGDWREAGLKSEKAYRHAKTVLSDCKLATFQGANKGTIATLADSKVFSISLDARGGQTGGQGDSLGADEGRTRGGQGATNHTDTQSTRITPPRVEESGADAYELIPTGNRPQLLELEKWVQYLRPEWKTTLMRSEQEILLQNAGCLDSLTADDWKTLRSYLHARIPEGVPKWQPTVRKKFLETCSDVVGHALRWKEKQADRRPAPVVKVSQPEQTEEDKAAVAEFLKAGIFKAKIP
jgi:hypothetical protein